MIRKVSLCQELKHLNRLSILGKVDRSKWIKRHYVVKKKIVNNGLNSVSSTG